MKSLLMEVLQEVGFPTSSASRNAAPVISSPAVVPPSSSKVTVQSLALGAAVDKFLESSEKEDDDSYDDWLAKVKEAYYMDESTGPSISDDLATLLDTLLKSRLSDEKVVIV